MAVKGVFFVLSRYRFRDLIKLVLFHPILSIRGLFGYPISDFSKNEIFCLLPDDPIIIEAGCADGADTLIFAQKYPSSKIVALEPMPELFEIASARTVDYSNVSIHKLALSNESNKISTLYTSSQNKIHQSSSLFFPIDHKKYHPEIEFDREVLVKTISLEDLLDFNGLQSVDLLWLDLQGYELLVLEGASLAAAGGGVLKRVKYIHTEISRIPLYEGAPTFEQLRDFLILNEFKLIKLRMPLVTGNAIFANTRMDNK